MFYVFPLPLWSPGCDASPHQQPRTHWLTPSRRGKASVTRTSLTCAPVHRHSDFACRAPCYTAQHDRVRHDRAAEPVDHKELIERPVNEDRVRRGRRLSDKVPVIPEHSTQRATQQRGRLSRTQVGPKSSTLPVTNRRRNLEC